MKNFDIEQFVEAIKRSKKRIFGFALILFLIGLGYLVYSAVKIVPDQAVISDYESKSKSYSLNFDKAFLKELYNKKSPTVVVGEGGRNPFAPY